MLQQEEEAEKEKLKREIEDMGEIEHTTQVSENEDFISLDAPSIKDGRSKNPYLEKKRRKLDEKLGEKVLDKLMEQELGPSITASGRHVEAEAETTLERKKEKRAEKRKRQAEEDKKEASLIAATDVDGETKTEGTSENPEDKKKKRKVEQNNTEDTETGSFKIKKDKKKRKEVSEDDDAVELADANETPKEKSKKKEKKEKRKKDKKGKKDKESAEEDVPAPTIEAESKTNGGEQWNVSALEGDAKRKQKFLRLLGGGKTNGITNSGRTVPPSSKADIAKVQSDLERQFDVGMKMKEEGHSRRKGLGA